MFENLKNFIEQNPECRIAFYLRDNKQATFDTDNLQKIDLSKNGIIKIISENEIILFNVDNIVKTVLIKHY